MTEERPYRNHSERELFELKKNEQDAATYWSKESLRLSKIGAPDEAKEASAHATYYTRMMKPYEDELAARRTDAKEEARLKALKPNAKQQRRAGGDRANQHLAEYFQRTNQTQPRNLTIRSIEFEWRDQDRRFLASVQTGNGSVRAWVEVPPGTLGSRRIKGRTYLPANSTEEIARARQLHMPSDAERPISPDE